MKRSFLALAASLLLSASCARRCRAGRKKTFYWVSHGAPTDPV